MKLLQGHLTRGIQAACLRVHPGSHSCFPNPQFPSVFMVLLGDFSQNHSSPLGMWKFIYSAFELTFEFNETTNSKNPKLRRKNGQKEKEQLKPFCLNEDKKMRKKPIVKQSLLILYYFTLLQNFKLKN